MHNKLAVTLVLGTIALAATVMAVNGPRAQVLEQTRKAGPTIIVACAYFNPADMAGQFGTRVVGVESSGPHDLPVTMDMTCAQAFESLIDAAFIPVHAGPTADGDFNNDGLVDAADYLVWR